MLCLVLCKYVFMAMEAQDIQYYHIDAVFCCCAGLCSSPWSPWTILCRCYVVFAGLCSLLMGHKTTSLIAWMLCCCAGMCLCVHCYGGTRQPVSLQGCCVVVQVCFSVFISIEAQDNQSHCTDVVLLCRYVFVCLLL